MNYLDRFTSSMAHGELQHYTCSNAHRYICPLQDPDSSSQLPHSHTVQRSPQEQPTRVMFEIQEETAACYGGVYLTASWSW
jgi:hypothetical protein